jgi:hypothetical protein
LGAALADTSDVPSRWRGLVVLTLIVLVVGTILVARRWSEHDVPAANTYSSASDLARELNEHGLGCDHPTRPRFQWYFPTLVCSVGGRPVVLIFVPPAFFKNPNGSQATSHYADLQDVAVQQAEAFETTDTMLVGPNWIVGARHERDAIPVLSSIRDEIGGTLVVASPTQTPSPQTPSPSTL